jgi:DNA-binding beta-propeller fold protein YncE
MFLRRRGAAGDLLVEKPHWDFSTSEFPLSLRDEKRKNYFLKNYSNDSRAPEGSRARNDQTAMKLNDIFDGSQTPFQGDRALTLRNIPANARILRATVRVTPVDATNGANPFAETIRFNGAVGDFGATRTAVADQWVEVDFHGRRVLSRVTGANLINTTLQVDLGGAYVEINGNGGIKAPGDTFFKLSGNSVALPSLTVTKLKLTNSTTPPVPPPVTPAGNDPNVSEVIIRSAPTNVNLRLGQTPPFWTHLGEMLLPETTPDYAEALQAFLAESDVENGFYVVPLTLHSDSIARLKLEIEIEFAVEQKALAAGVSEVKLEYDLSGSPKTQPDQLTIIVPAGMRVSSQGTSARVIGAFDSTRIVYNPTETILPDGVVKSVSPSGTVAVAPGSAPAQSIELEVTLSATAVDLFLSVTRTSRLRLDLREDLDGKPGDASLLPEPVNLEVPGPIGQERNLEEEKRRKWIGVSLPAEFQFQPKRRYWLLLQSVEGEAEWSVAPSTAGSLGMQRTVDGGLSWRAATASKISGPLAAFFRLRKVNERFRMPIALQAGAGEFPARVNLDRFEPLGRVDLALDVDLANALNTHLEKAATHGCPVTEHLVNGDFEQWFGVGDNLFLRQSLFSEDVGAVAFSPDGALAYVAVSDGEDPRVFLIDVTCGLPIKHEPISLTPQGAVISHDGTRAYFINREGILVIDAHTLRELMSVNTLEGAGDPISALSREDNRLFVSFVDDSTISVFDTSNLTILDSIDIVNGKLTSLAISSDGSRLYATVNGTKPNGEARIFDAATLRQIGDAINVGNDPIAIALTPDGQRAIVANKGGKTISVIDIATGNVFEPVNFGNTSADSPSSMAMAPAGTIVYVATKHPDTGASGKVRVVDLVRSRVVKQIEIENPASLTLAPSGAWLYVRSSGESLTPIQVGTPFPLEWNLTSGRVAPKCLPEPLLRAIELGQSGDAAISPSSLSQIAPVAAGCAYEFSFLAIADQPDAVAEVLWLNSQCGLIKTDQIPIESRLAAPPKDPGGIPLAFAATGAATPGLALHRARLAAPAGADQAEVRFIAPAGALAIIDSVSLMGTDETVINGDFRSESQGRLDGWVVSPAVAPGFSVIAFDDGAKLQNAGANAVALKQTIPAKSNRPFALEFQGQTKKLSANQANPRIEARLLDTGGATIGAPIALEIFADNFGASVTNGTSPENAVQAEINLIIPPGIVLQVRQVSLRFSSTTQIPVTFVAQSPGELVVTDLKVAFEEAAVAPPPIPERGLCRATPPGRAPGEPPHDCCFCPDCEEERTVIEDDSMVTRAGRPVSVGSCSECGLELAHFGGRSAVAQSLVFPTAGAVPPIVIHASTFAARALPITPPQLTGAADRPALTEIKGIGDATARRLEKIGIVSVEALAEAAPNKVMELKGISASKARQLVSAAKRLLRANR